MGNAMNEGMLMPYKKVLESIGDGDKKNKQDNQESTE